MRSDSSHHIISKAGGPADERLLFHAEPPDRIHVILSGDIRMSDPPLDWPGLAHFGLAGDKAHVRLDAGGLGRWDTAFLILIRQISAEAEAAGIRVETVSLPAGARRLLDLMAAAAPETRKIPDTDAAADDAGAPVDEISHPSGALLTKIIRRRLVPLHSFCAFLGEMLIAFGRLARGKACFRISGFIALLHECGPRALPITTLISLLVGLILAFVGAVQLKLFGAEIYVAALVGLGMAREMGAMMTGVLMAGRSGAAFAAEIGSMQANEEIDALRTFGISPMEFLVLPRMTAMILMMPLLTMYADLTGILGGAIVGIGLLDIAPAAYWEQTRSALDLTQFAVGVIKSVLFGWVVAVSGCLRGMQSGRNAGDVGRSATSAVVTAIVWIVIMDALFTLLFNLLGI
ncbi:MAG: hypothetical protein CSB33_02385 [Desulfobacterales bacterium]|nr:MAG: hypothetical protein CSB33_02385 [Desulfobacterales bacterium]